LIFIDFEETYMNFRALTFFFINIHGFLPLLGILASSRR
jgi:hypothetical protein